MPSIPDIGPFLMARDNRALDSNPPIANNNITTHGSDVDWAICALHAFLLLGVIGWTYMSNPRRRVFNYFAIGILLVATIYYFVMASDLGAHAVPVEFYRGNILNRTRQIFYTRWIGYFINFSLAIFALGLMSGVGWASILFSIGLTMLWTLLLLLGALVRSSYKWGFFVLALVSYILLAWQMLGVARGHANRLDATTHKTFSTLAAWLIGLMALYFIAWGVSEGGNRITNDSEVVFYAVLDVLSQGLWALGLIALARQLDHDYLRLGFSEFGRVRDGPGDYHHEKGVRGDNLNGHGVGNGTGVTGTHGAGATV